MIVSVCVESVCTMSHARIEVWALRRNVILGREMQLAVANLDELGRQLWKTPCHLHAATAKIKAHSRLGIGAS